MGETKTCKYCGKPIKKPRKNQQYHPKCRQKAEAERQRKRRQLRKEGLLPPTPNQLKIQEERKAPQKEKVVYRPVIIDRSPPGWSLKGKGRTQVSCEAKALGLTYGQYSIACTTGTIERVLRDRGINDGLKRIKKAWPLDKNRGEGK